MARIALLTKVIPYKLSGDLLKVNKFHDCKDFGTNNDFINSF